MEQRIGRYQILEEVAAGGQGTVYRAFDPDSGQIIALKVLHPTLSGDQGYIERFRREASLAASIDHPNVVKIFEVGQDGDQHFMALEFLPESLARVVGSVGQMRLEGAAQFGLQIAEGLAAAHDLGIVHRDIKPQNVLIGPDGTAKVTDFGIARAESLNTMTATGVVMGTPHYMSPEQARGERADARSDVYSLGCMMYHMLAGEVPFTGETPLAVIRQQIEVQPTRLRDRRKDVPRAMEAVIERSMAKDPGRRYQGAGEFAQAIRTAVPGASRPVTPVARSATPTPAVTPPQATPEPPSTTWMNAWAKSWGKAHRRRWAWVGTALSLGLALTVAGVRLDAYDAARDWIESTGIFVVAGVEPSPGEPDKISIAVGSAAEPPESAGMAPAVSLTGDQEPPGSLMPAHRTAQVPPATIIASSLSNVGPAGSPPIMREVAASRSAFFNCLVGVFGGIRAQDMLEARHGPTNDELVLIKDKCQEAFSQAGFNVAPFLVKGGQPRLAGAAPGMPRELAANFGPLYECMVGVVGSDRASEMFASGERPVGDEAALIFDACHEEISLAGLLEGPEFAREPLPRLDEPGSFAADPQQRFAEALWAYKKLESSSYTVVASDPSWKVSDRELPGWTEIGFDDASWTSAQVSWDYWDHDYIQSASPIWHPGRHEDDSNRYFFRKSFVIPTAEPLGMAELTIQVDDDYVLYLNGQEVARDKSGFTDPVATYDVAPYLNAGENVVAIRAIDTGGNEGVYLRLEVGPRKSDAQVALSDADSAIHVLANIDGRSQLLLRGGFAQWYQMEYAAPGREGLSDFPTILNGEEWLPGWPNEPDVENFDCYCESSVFQGLQPALPTEEADIRFKVLRGRGTVSIVELPDKANEFTLILEIDDNDFDGSDWYELLIVAGSRPAQVTTAPTPGTGLVRGATISGTVTDAATGLPIVDVEVDAEDARCRGTRPDTRTDAQGRYVMQGFAPGDYRIRVLSDDRGYIRQYYQDALDCEESNLVTVLGSDSVEGIDFQLSSGATISGRVFDAETGLPIFDAGISVAPTRGDDVAWSNTDGGGRYVIQGVPDGSVEVNVHGEGYIEERTRVEVSGTERIAGLDFGLARGSTISGRVVDAETGLPIPNIRIKADSIFDEPGVDGDTDADGRFELIGVAPGTYKLRAEGDRKGYIRTFYDDKLDWDNGDLVTVSGRSSVDGIDFALERGTSASGRVIDDETGLPIPNIELSARPLDGDDVSWSRTDADGNYTLRALPVGLVEIRTRGQEYIRERLKVMTVDSQVAAVPDLRLRLGATISGRVVDAVTSQPIADADIDADGINGTGSHNHSRTDSDGRYVLGGLAPGSYKIKVRAEEQNYIQQYYQNALDWDDAQALSVASRQSVENIDFRLALGASISGKVVDGATGSPIVDMEVYVDRLDGEGLDWTSTDGEGRYMLRGIPNGVMEVVVRGHGYIEARKAVTIHDGVDVTGFDF
jgi:serine/threonine protein kinase/protocatechuate 3,4-dioxygenase beta subunit